MLDYELDPEAYDHAHDEQYCLWLAENCKCDPDEGCSCEDFEEWLYQHLNGHLALEGE